MDGGGLRQVAPGAGREALMDLLLLADESPAQVAGYMHQGDLFLLEDDAGPLGLTLVRYEGDDTAELKAVAVRPDRQGQGVGKRMLTAVLDELRRAGVQRALIATGTSSLGPLALYQKLGFRLFRIDRDFFSPARGYPDEIVENGIRLRDMVWLDLDLRQHPPAESASRQVGESADRGDRRQRRETRGDGRRPGGRPSPASAYHSRSTQHAAPSSSALGTSSNTQHPTMTDRIRRIYDRRAADYDRSVGRAEGVLLGDFRRRFGALLAGEVLEVGIGSGLNLPFYGPTVTSAVGVDLSGGMLRIARERAAALGRPIRLVQADATRLPLPDAAFDTVAVSLVLCTVPDPTAALREAARVCRPGGRVVLLEHVASPAWLVALAQRLLSPLQERAIGCCLTRPTIDTARTLGFRVEDDSARLLGVVRLVVARPAAAGGPLAAAPAADAREPGLGMPSPGRSGDGR